MKILKTLVKKVVTAGTELPLSTTKILAYGTRIKAPAGNAGVVYIGDSTVASTTGYELAAGETLNLDDLLPASQQGEPIDLSLVYVDAATNGEGVCVLYLDNKLG